MIPEAISDAEWAGEGQARATVTAHNAEAKADHSPIPSMAQADNTTEKESTRR